MEDENKLSKSKKFDSYDSLRFEKERLETFIEWPVQWLNPNDLAKNGFYYLRKDDHCACVFCRGIVGMWEKGDTPEGEHKRHFPHCQFISNKPVGNIPISVGKVLLKMTPLSKDIQFIGKDVCGASNYLTGSYGKCNENPMMDKRTVFDIMGVLPHIGPKRKEYLTYESRVKSFGNWPNRVTQNPFDLAEAGFFACGLSDHVRCFYCGTGIRNWESDGIPWIEHAHWNPKCKFMLETKGQEFIDTVIRDISQNKVDLTEDDLDKLMQLDIICEVIRMGFPFETVKSTLRQKIQETRLPFFSVNSCTDAICNYMENELKQVVQDSTSTLQTPISNSTPLSSISTLSSTSPSNSVISVSSTEENVHPIDEINLCNSKKIIGEVSNLKFESDQPTALKSSSELAEELERICVLRQCKVCLNAEMKVVFLPCKHMTCSLCALLLEYCPICRDKIEFSFKPIFS